MKRTDSPQRGVVRRLRPVRGHEQGQDRPALVVSSAFHLEITGGSLTAVLPLASRERSGWLHRPHLKAADGGSSPNKSTPCPHSDSAGPPLNLAPTDEQLATVRRFFARMLML